MSTALQSTSAFRPQCYAPVASPSSSPSRHGRLRPTPSKLSYIHLERLVFHFRSEGRGPRWSPWWGDFVVTPAAFRTSQHPSGQ